MMDHRWRVGLRIDLRRSVDAAAPHFGTPIRSHRAWRYVVVGGVVPAPVLTPAQVIELPCAETVDSTHHRID